MTNVRSAAFRLLGPVLARAGSAYLVAPDLPAATAIARRLTTRGHEVTLAYWPGADDAAATVLTRTRAAVEALRGGAGSPQVAVKAPALAGVPTAARDLGRQAADAGVGLVFDSHAPADTDATLAAAAVAQDEGTTVGVALPARWGRSLDDAGIAAKAGFSVRVVKGQWPDAAGGPVGERSLRATYLELLDRLAELAVPIGVATHDPVLLDAALARLAATGASGEAEVLLGLPVRRPLAVVARHHAPVRFYLAFGHPSLTYPLTAVLRRPRLAGTLAQGLLLGARNQRVQQRDALANR
jgi:proline dehydrogenase